MNELPNYTATEVQASIAAGIKGLVKAQEAAIAPLIDSVLDILVAKIPGMTVCARRARKLRKRGYRFRVVGRTPRGKSRYLRV